MQKTVQHPPTVPRRCEIMATERVRGTGTRTCEHFTYLLLMPPNRSVRLDLLQETKGRRHFPPPRAKVNRCLAWHWWETISKHQFFCVSCCCWCLRHSRGTSDSSKIQDFQLMTVLNPRVLCRSSNLSAKYLSSSTCQGEFVTFVVVFSCCLSFQTQLIFQFGFICTGNAAGLKSIIHC